MSDNYSQIIDLISELAENENLRVAVVESAKGAVAIGVSALVGGLLGGLLGGRVGLGIGKS